MVDSSRVERPVCLDALGDRARGHREVVAVGAGEVVHDEGGAVDGEGLQAARVLPEEVLRRFNGRVDLGLLGRVNVIGLVAGLDVDPKHLHISLCVCRTAAAAAATATAP